MYDHTPYRSGDAAPSSGGVTGIGACVDKGHADWETKGSTDLMMVAEILLTGRGNGSCGGGCGVATSMLVPPFNTFVSAVLGVGMYSIAG